MKKVTLFVCCVLLFACSVYANEAVFWKNNTVTTTRAAIEVNSAIKEGYHTIYNNSGVSYFLAEDASGTNEVEIDSSVLFFSLGKVTPIRGTSNALFRYVRVATGSATLTIFSTSSR